MTAIVAFLHGEGADGAGRKISEIWRFNAGELERDPDVVQWLFPLQGPGGAAIDAPALSTADVDAIRASAVAQENLVRSATLMAQFFQANDHWLRPRDPNNLSITRIIKSLRLLVDDAAADGFRDAILAKVTERQAAVGVEMWRQWTNA